MTGRYWVGVGQAVVAFAVVAAPFTGARVAQAVETSRSSALIVRLDDFGLSAKKPKQEKIHRVGLEPASVPVITEQAKVPTGGVVEVRLQKGRFPKESGEWQVFLDGKSHGKLERVPGDFREDGTPFPPRVVGGVRFLLFRYHAKSSGNVKLEFDYRGTKGEKPFLRYVYRVELAVVDAKGSK
jgi:hypothetical protein